MKCKAIHDSAFCSHVIFRPAKRWSGCSDTEEDIAKGDLGAQEGPSSEVGQFGYEFAVGSQVQRAQFKYINAETLVVVTWGAVL